MKATAAWQKREKDDPQNSTTTDTGETPRIEDFSRDGNVEFAWTPNQNHDFICRIRFRPSVIVIPTRWTKPPGTPELLRQPYGRWDYGTSELKYYGEKVENKNPGNSSPITPKAMRSTANTRCR